MTLDMIQASAAYESRRRQRAAAGEPVFDPSQVDGLALWLDASVTASVTLDGSDGVSQWADQSGNGRHATQPSAGNRPTYTSGVSVDGDGSQWLEVAHALALSTDGGITVFAVGQSTSESGSNQVAVSKAPTSSEFRLFFFHSNPNAARFVAWDTSTGHAADGAADIRDGDPHILQGCVEPGERMCLRVDGELSDESTPFGTPSTNSSDLILFANRDDGQLSFPGSLHAVLVFDHAITSEERVAVRNYLASKWGVSV